MSESENTAVNASVVSGFENLQNLMKSAVLEAEMGSPEFKHLLTTSAAVKELMETYSAGPKARKAGGRRGRPPKAEQAEVAEAAE